MKSDVTIAQGLVEGGQAIFQEQGKGDKCHQGCKRPWHLHKIFKSSETIV